MSDNEIADVIPLTRRSPEARQCGMARCGQHPWPAWGVIEWLDDEEAVTIALGATPGDRQFICEDCWMAARDLTESTGYTPLRLVEVFV